VSHSFSILSPLIAVVKGASGTWAIVAAARKGCPRARAYPHLGKQRHFLLALVGVGTIAAAKISQGPQFFVEDNLF
jgi:hypothetical protein